jgi:hypothetical protein
MHLIIGYGLFWTYHRFCNKINTTGATSRVGTAYPSGAPEFTPVFSGVRVAPSLVFYVVFCTPRLSGIRTHNISGDKH